MGTPDDFCVKVPWFYKGGRKGPASWLCARFYGPQAMEFAQASIAMMDRDGIPHEAPQVAFGDTPSPMNAVRRALDRPNGDVEPRPH